MNYLIDGEFDADRNGVIDGDDDRDGTPDDDATNGEELSSEWRLTSAMVLHRRRRVRRRR